MVTSLVAEKNGSAEGSFKAAKVSPPPLENPGVNSIFRHREAPAGGTY
jgi:hypothetical protein